MCNLKVNIVIVCHLGHRTISGCGYMEMEKLFKLKPIQQLLRMYILDPQWKRVLSTYAGKQSDSTTDRM